MRIPGERIKRTRLIQTEEFVVEVPSAEADPSGDVGS
jgi:hypothetical protein